METDVQSTLELLAAIAAEPQKAGRVLLSSAYLRAIAVVENLPSNQRGSDKTWIHAALARDSAHFKRAVRRQKSG